MRGIFVLTISLSSVAVAAGQQRAIAPGVLVRQYQVAEQLHAVPEIAPGELPNDFRVVKTIDLGEDESFGSLENNFVTDVSGYIRVMSAGRHTFQLLSDDGARLWVRGQVVVDNDGLHGAIAKEGTIDLPKGRHGFRILHFDAGGGKRLALRWKPPTAADDADFKVVPAEFLMHNPRLKGHLAAGNKRVIQPLRRGLPGDGVPQGEPHPGFRVGFEAAAPTPADDLRFENSYVVDMSVSGAAKPPAVAWVPDGVNDYVSRDVVPLNDDHYPDNLIISTPTEDKRVYVETIHGRRQGCVFRFGQSQDATLEPAAGASVFEMQAVRALTDGFEIEFTQPLDPRVGWDSDGYKIEQWPFNHAQGVAPLRDGKTVDVAAASVSADRKRVHLRIPRLSRNKVTYIRLLTPFVSENGKRPWSTEAWYTLLAIPADKRAEITDPPVAPPQNFLTLAEREAGWRLLFDGESTKGWRGYGKEEFPERGWTVRDGCLAHTRRGGDIITQETFGDFELTLEWRISPRGNSGIFYRVDESVGPPWETGPEMQVLDNAEHPDGRNVLTSAGSNYGLYAPIRDIAQPVGFFNEARIVARGALIEHWLNGVKIVEYELGTDDWAERVANSKFKVWPEYGQRRDGHIVLQDHGDKVWYRNIKIRRLENGE